MPKKAEILETIPVTESWTFRFKRDVQKFHELTGMKHTTIGAKSIKNARLWQRLEDGGSITLEIADQVYDWMAKQGHNFNR